MEAKDFFAILVAVTAVSVSIWQVRWAQWESRRKLTLDHLHRVLGRVQTARLHDFRQSQQDVLDFYEHRCNSLTSAATEHLLLLDEMDLLALAVAKDTVDGEIVREYLRSTYSANAGDTIHFINRVRRCFSDQGMYEHLYDLLPTFYSSPPRWASSYSPDSENPYEHSLTPRESAPAIREPGAGLAEGPGSRPSSQPTEKISQPSAPTHMPTETSSPKSGG